MRTLTLTIALVGLVFPAASMAKPTFPMQVPNGNVLSCNTCHIPNVTKKQRNLFGQDVDANLKGGVPDWTAVCNLDSDGDGATNGEELLDPLCEWVKSTPNPSCSVHATAPGDANSQPGAAACGDGNCDPGETFGCCPADCLCGNGDCDDGEDFDNCPNDCDEPPPPVDEGTEEDIFVEPDSGNVQVDVGPDEDTSSSDNGAPQADAGPPTDNGPVGDSQPANDKGGPGGNGGGNDDDDGGCSVSGQAPPPWLGLLALFFFAAILRRRDPAE